MLLYFLLHVHEVACKQAFGDTERGHITHIPRVSSQVSDREISPCFINENESHFRTCKLRHDVSYTCLHYKKNWTQCSVFDLKKKNIPQARNQDFMWGGANEAKVDQTTEMYFLLSDPFI